MRRKKESTFNNYDKYRTGITKPNLPSLIILILIILQFTKGHGNSDGFNGVDNGILFIIAIFYLNCCNNCRTTY